MLWQLLQQRDLVLEKVIAPKRASCDRNGRVVAAWLVQCFVCPSFLAMFGVAGTVSTQLLDITIAVCFTGLYVPGTFRKLRPCPPDFSPATRTLLMTAQKCRLYLMYLHVWNMNCNVTPCLLANPELAMVCSLSQNQKHVPHE